MSGFVCVEQSIAAMLAADTQVAALCGGRVFPLKLPQGATLPAVVYQRLSCTPNATLQGCVSEHVLVMVSSYALTYEAAKDLARAVRVAMAAGQPDAVFMNEKDVDEENAEGFCVSAEYLCQQTGGYSNG